MRLLEKKSFTSKKKKLEESCFILSRQQKLSVLMTYIPAKSFQLFLTLLNPYRANYK